MLTLQRLHQLMLQILNLKMAIELFKAATGTQPSFCAYTSLFIFMHSSYGSFDCAASFHASSSLSCSHPPSVGASSKTATLNPLCHYKSNTSAQLLHINYSFNFCHLKSITLVVCVNAIVASKVPFTLLHCNNL